jgi:hypothetical protein
MMVLCSNHSSRAFVALAHKTKRLGWMIGPTHYKTPRADIPFALDNDAYIAWKNGKRFDADAWLRMIEKVNAQGLRPMWALVPDVVADRERTLEAWSRHWRTVAEAGFQPAFAVQDGMASCDVPSELAEGFSVPVVFIGGTTQWKWRTASDWCSKFPRVHLGRCGTSRWKLERIEELGCESCDGSGFFRATINGREARQLKAYLSDDKHQQLKFL